MALSYQDPRSRPENLLLLDDEAGDGSRVQGLGFGVWGLGFRYGSRVQGLGFGVWGLGFR